MKMRKVLNGIYSWLGVWKEIIMTVKTQQKKHQFPVFSPAWKQQNDLTLSSLFKKVSRVFTSKASLS